MPPPPELLFKPPRTQRLYILAGLWLFVALVLVTFHAVLLPFVGAALIAYLVQPLVRRITRLRVGGRAVPHWVAILLIYALFFLGVYLFFVGLLPQLYRELARISRDAVAYANALTPEKVELIAQRAESWLLARGIPVALSERALEGASSAPYAGPAKLNLSLDLEQLIRDAATRVSGYAGENVKGILDLSRRIVTGVLVGVFTLFFMLMVAAFFSIDAQPIRRYALSLIPPEYAADARLLSERIDRALSGVVRGQATICVVNGLLTGVGMLLFGVKFVFLLATVATLFSLIPIFGTILSSVPIVLIALSDGVQKAFAILLWIIGIHALEAYVLNPKIMGSAARIHPVIVAFALIAGEHFFGLVGALLAAPLTAVLVACFDYLRLKAQPEPAVLGPVVAAPPPAPAPPRES
ncbi:AI-2E family transporter [Aggregicoccus sp. 17bor-14]|uniref:AI-2E family transporter n=1 Tax=Myxococcaceae TaxID=31 RepID=UPI00129D0CA1|nr:MULTISPECIES: AI-2E family transporter [Myxococcaceae]MBF5044385.1 AI-2E family transporter [Simulacricoccus sp. 17bor-14]MRI90132.1 AI-2E family transporter [Aggregicoccus sp. 17bor-14]